MPAQRLSRGPACSAQRTPSGALCPLPFITNGAAIPTVTPRSPTGRRSGRLRRHMGGVEYARRRDLADLRNDRDGR
jgi:hypothetical protein